MNKKNTFLICILPLLLACSNNDTSSKSDALEKSDSSFIIEECESSSCVDVFSEEFSDISDLEDSEDVSISSTSEEKHDVELPWI